MWRVFIFCTGLLIIASGSIAAERSLCKESDRVCKEIESLSEARQFGAIIQKIDTTVNYSEGSRNYIGRAYLELAAAETNTPEQEEAFCRQALEFGASQAYMGLYFIYAQSDEARALGFLRQYIASKPRDPVPYVILGENELGRKNYSLADTYLREAKKVAWATSPRVDWMLFQANYLLGNYQAAGEMLENALQNGQFDLKTLASDARFKGIAHRPEFKKYQALITAADVRS